MLQHEHSIIAFIDKMALSCATYPVGRNMSYLCDKFDIGLTDSFYRNVLIEYIVELRFAPNTKLLSIVLNLYSASSKVNRISMVLIMKYEIFY